MDSSLSSASTGSDVGERSVLDVTSVRTCCISISFTGVDAYTGVASFDEEPLEEISGDRQRGAQRHHWPVAASPSASERDIVDGRRVFFVLNANFFLGCTTDRT